jgi:hypothetical protein
MNLERKRRRFILQGLFKKVGIVGETTFEDPQLPTTTTTRTFDFKYGGVNIVGSELLFGSRSVMFSPSSFLLQPFRSELVKSQQDKPDRIAR